MVLIKLRMLVDIVSS